MLEFKKLEYSDYNTVKEYFIRDNIKCSSNGSDITCDHVFGTTFLWRGYYNTRYAVTGDSVVLQISTGGTDMFSVPIGGNDIQGALESVKEYAHERGIALYFTFVPENYLQCFRDTYDIVFTSEEPDWSDYVYDIASLADYPGRAYHGQKNFLNRFKKQNPDAAFIPICKDNTDIVMEYAKKWHEKYSDNSDMAAAEENAIYDLLNNWESNSVFSGGYITSKDGIAGFTVAEVAEDTVYIHIEKADHGNSGAYQFLLSEYLKSITDEKIKWVNREEDMGIPGLRTAKMALHPVKLLKKYTLYCC